MVDMIQTSTLPRFGKVLGRVDPVTMILVEASLSVHLGLLGMPEG
jgi:mRNA-degrading endonuclease toxin of MazEF toxin-antitoxin module